MSVDPNEQKALYRLIGPPIALGTVYVSSILWKEYTFYFYAAGAVIGGLALVFGFVYAFVRVIKLAWRK